MFIDFVFYYLFEFVWLVFSLGGSSEHVNALSRLGSELLGTAEPMHVLRRAIWATLRINTQAERLS